MRKLEELHNPQSCLNKAADDEPVFVLLARDRAAIYAIREWINQRIALGLNKDTDTKLTDAWQWCLVADKWRAASGR